MTEQQAIEQLSTYRQKQARLQVLSTYSVGAGITVSRLNEDDHLRELHAKLRGLPSYMYLTKREQQLESVAHAYLTRYPAGTRAQLAAVPTRGADEEDEKLLQEIRGKIKKVIAARGWEMDDLDAVLERVAEYQDLKTEIERIDTVLAALEAYKPGYAKLLRIHYLDGKPWDETARELNVSKDVFYRWRKKALEEYEKIAK
ncbi:MULTISPECIES: sigma-70 family RNA polymerase sigma factor [Myxococcaceae]|uniref:sigma-70 family RNA polymerase sigma factor n=1 Tax=Myxococcaceae TaxID=31 RepID=UPI00148CE939|nr:MULTISPECIES: sigma-70 family RNA polymerase sigma factor [Myxococcaceae]NOK23844.1 sigma-70 family RNA polymerase sigma factor [Corallococcus carmarthensis]NTX58853.1 sigma-70 family RNA polymerase sigma factor [Myxococcus sp. CA039A]